MRPSLAILSWWQSLAPSLTSLLRLIAGLLVLEYGLAKIFGFPASISHGEPLPPLIYASGLIELVAGSMLTVGLSTRPFAFLVSGEMAVVYALHSAPRGPLPASNGGDLAITWCFLFLYLSAAGGGPLSLDAFIARRRSPKQSQGSEGRENATVQGRL